MCRYLRSVRRSEAGLWRSPSLSTESLSFHYNIFSLSRRVKWCDLKNAGISSNHNWPKQCKKKVNFCLLFGRQIWAIHWHDFWALVVQPQTLIQLRLGVRPNSPAGSNLKVNICGISPQISQRKSLCLVDSELSPIIFSRSSTNLIWTAHIDKSKCRVPSVVVQTVCSKPRANHRCLYSGTKWTKKYTSWTCHRSWHFEALQELICRESHISLNLWAYHFKFCSLWIPFCNILSALLQKGFSYPSDFVIGESRPSGARFILIA